MDTKTITYFKLVLVETNVWHKKVKPEATIRNNVLFSNNKRIEFKGTSSTTPPKV